MFNILKIYIWVITLSFCFNVLGQSNNKHYNKAINHSLNENIEGALNSINMAIDSKKNKVPPVFYFRKYEYLIKLQKFKLAIQTLNDAIYILSNSTLLLNARAEFYFALKMYRKSILDYKKIITLVKAKELIHYKIKLAGTKFLVRDFNDVALILKEILEKDSSNIDVLNLLAVLHVELLNYTKAKEILLNIISKYPSHFSTIINLGFVYQKENQHKKAISCFNKALKLSPKNPIALSNRAYSKLETLNIDEAISDVNQSIHLLQSNSYAYMIKGKIFLKLNETKKACVNFSIAKNLKFSEQYGAEVDKLINKNCK